MRKPDNHSCRSIFLILAIVGLMNGLSVSDSWSRRLVFSVALARNGEKASWKPVNNGLNVVGRILAIDPTNTAAIYAGTTGGDTLKSIDGGASWNRIEIGVPYIRPDTLVIDNVNPKIVYAAMSRLGLVNAPGDRFLFKSADGGATWSNDNSPLDFDFALVALDPTSSETLYVGSAVEWAGTGSCFLRKSTDGGATWNLLRARNVSIAPYGFTINPADPQTLYAPGDVYRNGSVIDSGLFKSTDGGASWLATGLITTAVRAVAIDPANPNTLYVGSSDYVEPKLPFRGMLKSSDGGATWFAINSGLNNVSVINAITLDQDNSNILYIGTSSGVFKTTDGGANWIAFNEGLTDLRIGGLVLAPGDPNTLYANTRGAAFKIIDVVPPQSAKVTSVSAASYGPGLANECIAAGYGASLATTTLSAASLPLPTELAGTTVKVKDNAGAERIAPLFFVSPTQVNYQIPPGTTPGTATVTIISGDGSVSSGLAFVSAVAPSLFAANANGQGVAAAVALRVKADGTRSYEEIAQFDLAQNKLVGRPLDLGPEGDLVFVLFFGTGIRFRSSLSAVIATIGGANAEVSFAGAQPDYTGLDQVNVLLPRSLIGRGDVDALLRVDGEMANRVLVSIK